MPAERSTVHSVSADGSYTGYAVRFFFFGLTTAAECPICWAMVSADSLVHHCFNAHNGLRVQDFDIPKPGTGI